CHLASILDPSTRSGPRPRANSISVAEGTRLTMRIPWLIAWKDQEWRRDGRAADRRGRRGAPAGRLAARGTEPGARPEARRLQGGDRVREPRRRRGGGGEPPPGHPRARLESSPSHAEHAFRGRHHREGSRAGGEDRPAGLRLPGWLLPLCRR